MANEARNEEWRDVIGWEGLYKVSRNGDVYSLRRKIKLQKLPQGKYLMVNLSRGGKITRVLIHRLVAEAFIDNPEGKPYIDHINGDGMDNRVENLRWVTSSENNSYANGIKVECVEEHEVFLSGGFAGRWLKENSKIKATNISGISSRIMEACRLGSIAYGYHWRFAEDDMGKMSREKGKRGEREVANILKEYGYDAKRGVQYQGSPDSPDVIGLPGVHLEVKRTERFDLYGAMDQAMRDMAQDDSEIPVVVHRRNGMDWVAVLPFREFLELYRKAGE